MMTVEETLKIWRQTYHEYGKTDCMLSIGDYIAANGGKDIAPEYRNTYSTRDEAIALCDEAGGPEGLIDLTGIERISPDEVQPGDVVVFDTGCDGHDKYVPGLCTEIGIAGRLERGVIEVDKRFIKIIHAWKINR